MGVFCQLVKLQQDPTQRSNVGNGYLVVQGIQRIPSAVCPGLVFIEKLQKDDLLMTYFAV